MPESAPFHAPFRGLAGKVRPTAPPFAPRSLPSSKPAKKPAKPATAVRARSSGRRAPVRPSVPPKAAVALEDDHAFFERAMADVRRLQVDGRVDAPPPALHVRRAPVSEEAEALVALSDLVAGTGAFDVSDSAEYVEGAVVGLDPRILRRLRRGEFAYQAYVDLHGMSAAAARLAVERFICDAFASGNRAVLVVHGRGRNSKDNVPVLKERLKSWLARGRIGRVVLAFSSARPADGGTGALYVLLRRRRGAREPIAVLEGAKRE
ncbi:MAG: Smr/MutS family protein [Deltaproteobacteria bacterium]|nr:Smr/MutS family protein [Deltaproteobacteria bacterium]